MCHCILFCWALCMLLNEFSLNYMLWSILCNIVPYTYSYVPNIFLSILTVTMARKYTNCKYFSIYKIHCNKVSKEKRKKTDAKKMWKAKQNNNKKWRRKSTFFISCFHILFPIQKDKLARILIYSLKHTHTSFKIYVFYISYWYKCLQKSILIRVRICIVSLCVFRFVKCFSDSYVIIFFFFSSMMAFKRNKTYIMGEYKYMWAYVWLVALCLRALFIWDNTSQFQWHLGTFFFCFFISSLFFHQ